MVDGEPKSGAEPPGPPSPETAAPVDSATEWALCRDDVNGVLTGVAAGLGRHTGIDPVVWRAAFAVTALAGGTGLWLYFAAWLLTRDARGGPAMLEQLLNRRLGGEAVLALLGAGLALATVFSLVGGFGWTTLVLAVPLILGVLVAHNRGVDLTRTAQQLPGWLKDREPPPSAPESDRRPAYYNPAQPWAAAPNGPVDLAVVAQQVAEDTGEQEDGDGEDGGSEGPPRPPRQEAHLVGAVSGEDGNGEDGGSVTGPPPRKPKEDGRSRDDSTAGRTRCRGVRLLDIAFWVVLAFTVAVFAVSGEVSAEALVGPQAAPAYLGGVVALLGAALVVGTWAGDPRGVVWVATLVTLLAAVATTVDLTRLRFGEEVWRPTAVSEIREPFELTVGQARLDLTELPLEPGQEVTVRTRVEFGSLDVLAPEAARVVVHGRATFGSIRLDDRLFELGMGLNVDDVLEPASVSERGGEEATGADIPTLTLYLRSHAGDLEVRHASA